jgi:RNA polymerase sigma-70 factor (ECF subfamily)
VLLRDDDRRVNDRQLERTARLEEHRAALTGHCYRMLGSAVDADDAVQETMVRAWRSLDGFDGRASLRTWLYRIATNVCLDALAERRRRVHPMDEAPAGSVHDPLVELPRTHWLEPVPDARALPRDADPSELAMLRRSIRLAFVAALQRLPPKQRAALILAEVLGWSAAEVAETLDTTVAAVNSALQRARATLAVADPGSSEPLSEAQERLLDRYVDAFHRYDADALASLLRDDVVFSMPPYALWLRGPDAVRGWLVGRGRGCRGSRLLPTGACGSPAFAQYRPRPEGGHAPWALVVLELSGDRIAGWTSFLDTATLFPLFGLPLELPG